MNRLEEYAGIFDGIRPWSGMVPRGYLVDFLGVLTEAAFRSPFGVNPTTVGGEHVATRLPCAEDGEGWFEAVDSVVAAREARDRYTMITLGACYGAQAVCSQRALQLLNPMPYKLVSVEPEPENYEWVIRHLRNNGIDPDGQWLIKAALSSDNVPVLFPVGAPGTGAQNCVSTNEAKSRQIYADLLIAGGAKEALRRLLIQNTSGLKHRFVEDQDWEGEIKLVSAVTLNDVLGPFDFVDYLEADIQQSEIIVFPPAARTLKRKVRRIHIGTHGTDIHWSLHQMFEKQGWEIVFSYKPGSAYREALGNFATNDGVLTVRNPEL